jgi:hypothetical protein
MTADIGFYLKSMELSMFQMFVFCNAFDSRCHFAIVKNNEIHLIFGKEERSLTLILKNSMPVAKNVTLKHSVSVPEKLQQKCLFLPKTSGGEPLC